MLPKLSILVKAASAIMMIAALLFLTTANFWVYGFQHQNQTISSTGNPASDEEDSGSSVPNPVEEKNSNTLQNLSEYLHDGHDHLAYQPLAITSFGKGRDFIKLPIHHPELLTPPPKAVA